MTSETAGGSGSVSEPHERLLRAQRYSPGCGRGFHKRRRAHAERSGCGCLAERKLAAESVVIPARCQTQPDQKRRRCYL